MSETLSRYLRASVLAGLLLLAIRVVAIRPMQAMADSEQASLDAERWEIERGNALDAAMLQDSEAVPGALQQVAKELSIWWNSSPAERDLYSHVEQLGGESGVEIIVIDPRMEKPDGRKSGSVIEFNKVSVRIEARGTSSQFTLFLDGLLHRTGMARVDSFRMRGAGVPGQVIGEVLLTSLTVSDAPMVFDLSGSGDREVEGGQ